MTAAPDGRPGGRVDGSGRPSGRPSVELDGEWRFVPDTERLYDPDRLPEGEPIGVPGCWEAQVPRPYRIITAWYHRTFEVPEDWRGQRAILRFGAVMYRCTVFVNGQRVGVHEGGYTSFAFDVTDAVAWGATNRLAVEVQNPLNAIADYPALAVERVLSAEEYAPDLPLSEAPHGKQTWYSSQSGIWQSVCIERTPAAFVTSALVLPDLRGAAATVRWSIDGLDTPGTMRLVVTGPDGTEVSATEVAVAPGDDRGETRVPVPDPVTWGIGRPNLYRLSCHLAQEGGAEDHYTVRFGMREIATENGVVTLNGEPIYLLAALDQDLYPDSISTPPSRAFLDEQLARARELGFNMLRCHIKVPDPAYLDAADEAGMLLWCELPNWTRFTADAALRGRATLQRMVETMGNHPSVVIWTIINEDWGTRLRYERRDRQWLRRMYDWLKALDPSRLVVDNSACETSETPNFHVRSDLADFHVYFGQDNGVRWGNMIADFARRPDWLWSPHGDAEPQGDEPLILSEFGGWGLPRLDRMLEHHRGREPWWFGTGHGYYRPSGMRRRFQRFGLDRIWPDVNALADATQWQQFTMLQYQIGELRRHESITGYVVTELTDAYWEANGVLDPMRGRKVYHDRFRQINAPTTLVLRPDRRDVWGGSTLRTEVGLSAYEDGPAGPGRVEWRLSVPGADAVAGSAPVDAWPRAGVAGPVTLEVPIPRVERAVYGELEARAIDADGNERTRNAIDLAVLPPLPAGGSGRSRRVAVHDPGDIWGIADRLRATGHQVVAADDADVLVAAELTPAIVAYAESGGRVLGLVRSRSAIPPHLDLRRAVDVHLRRLPHAGWPGQRSPWEGDWVSNFNWILPDAFAELPYRAPLDVGYEEVAPDHVLLGYDPVRHRDEVVAGMFVGWVHEPAALVWSFGQGRGSLAFTTFRLVPEDGPIATTMLEALVQRLAVPPEAEVEDPVYLVPLRAPA
jgi:hypothetical protein